MSTNSKVNIQSKNKKQYVIDKFNQALRMREHGFREQAIEILNEILNKDSLHYESLYVLSLLYFEGGNLNEGINIARRAIRVNHKDSTLHNNIGSALAQCGRYEDALISFENALRITPGYADAIYNKGSALLDIGLYEESVTTIKKAIKLDPKNPIYYNSLSLSLLKSGKTIESLDAVELALFYEPNFSEAHYNHGCVLTELGMTDRALFSFDCAIATDKKFTKAFYNRANLLLGINDVDAAIIDFKKTIYIDGTFIPAYNNLGAAYIKLNDVEGAISIYQKGLENTSQHSELLYNLSIAQLLSGDLINGFQNYEYRLSTDELSKNYRTYQKPIWHGQKELKNTTILIHAEQGIGDTIQFSRYIKFVEILGAKVIFEVQDPLIYLFKDFGRKLNLIPLNSPLPDYDFHCPLLSLPYLFKTELDNIPKPDLSINKSIRQLDPALRDRIFKSKNKRIGLVWSGNPNHSNDSNRSVPLNILMKFLPAGLDYFSIQKDVRIADLPVLEHSEIIRLDPYLSDFLDTALVCELMDIIITVDTSVAHLSASLNLPTWILLPFSPDWRWLLDRDDSPWYESVRLFRQQSISCWDEPLRKIQNELSLMVSDSCQ